MTVLNSLTINLSILQHLIMKTYSMYASVPGPWGSFQRIWDSPPMMHTSWSQSFLCCWAVLNCMRTIVCLSILCWWTLKCLFPVLYITNKAAINFIIHTLVCVYACVCGCMFLWPLCSYWRVELLDNRYFTVKWTTEQISKALVPLYTPTSNVW